LQILYTTIDQKAVRLADRIFGFSFPGLGIILVFISLYLLGLLSSNLIGRQIFGLAERISKYIPLVKSIYKIGQQLGTAFSIPEKQVFKKAVLVEYLKPGMWTIGFVTGEAMDIKNNNERLLKIFIPTPPNPASGTMIVVRESQIRDPGWTLDEALQSVLSGGIIGPEKIG
jgi:uncharacterized membrane protein